MKVTKIKVILQKGNKTTNIRDTTIRYLAKPLNEWCCCNKLQTTNYVQFFLFWLHFGLTPLPFIISVCILLNVIINVGSSFRVVKFDKLMVDIMLLLYVDLKHRKKRNPSVISVKNVFFNDLFVRQQISVIEVFVYYKSLTGTVT